MKKLIALLIGVCPFGMLRIFLWRLLFNYKISYSSKIGWGNCIYCNRVEIVNGRIGYLNRISCNELVIDNAEIGRLNLIKLLNCLHLNKGSLVNSNNSLIGLYRENEEYKYKNDCNITLGCNSLITVRHEFDATRAIKIGDNVVFGGKDTQIWTHGFDTDRNMVTGGVFIGDDVYIGSRCTITQGVKICDKTIVGAATCVSKSIDVTGFYVSNELIRKSDFKIYEKSDYE